MPQNLIMNNHVDGI